MARPLDGWVFSQPRPSGLGKGPVEGRVWEENHGLSHQRRGAWSEGDLLEGWGITVNDLGPGLWCSPIEAFQRQKWVLAI